MTVSIADDLDMKNIGEMLIGDGELIRIADYTSEGGPVVYQAMVAHARRLSDNMQVITTMRVGKYADRPDEVTRITMVIHPEFNQGEVMLYQVANVHCFNCALNAHMEAVNNAYDIPDEIDTFVGDPPEPVHLTRHAPVPVRDLEVEEVPDETPTLAPYEPPASMQ